MLKRFIVTGKADLGLLLLRISIPTFMAAGHGWGKLTGFNQYFHSFSDPIGFGHEITYLVAVLSEFFCSIFLAVGLFTRIAAIPPVVTMFIAGFIVHGADDPWRMKEAAMMYLTVYLTILIAGPGKYSLDNKFFKS